MKRDIRMNHAWHDEFEYEMRNGGIKKKVMTSWINLKERNYAQESTLANKKTEKNLGRFIFLILI